MTAENSITDLLAAPVSPDWTVERLAEQVLGAIAAQRSEEAQEFILDADTATDRQSRRVLRPLLACLATKSAAEAGTPANLYGGRLSFQRPGPEGPIWIFGQFENKPGAVRVVFRRSASPPQNSEPRTVQPPVFTGACSLSHASEAVPSRPPEERAARTRPDRLVLADKRRRAKAWVADYVKAAPAWPLVFVGVSESIPQTSQSHAVKMCYEIGRIYRDDWSHADAERLASTLSIPDRIASPGVGTAVGYFSFIPVIGAMLASTTQAHRLRSASESIIEYFEAAP